MRMNWDLLIIMLALYNCVMIPLNVAFNVELELSGGIGGLEKLIDVLFILDIILNFRTTFINPKTNIEISDNKRVAQHYINSIRFPVDVLASIPFDDFITIEESTDGGNTLAV